MKIGAKLISVGTIIIAVPLLAVAVVAVTRSRAGLEYLSEQQLVSRAQEIAGRIDGIYAEEMKLGLSLETIPCF